MSSTGKLTRSDLGMSLRQVAPAFGSDLSGSLLEVTPGFVLCRLAMETRATSERRSGKSFWEGCLAIETRATSPYHSRKVAMGGVSHDRNASDLSMSLWPGRSGMCVIATSCSRSGKSLQEVAPGSARPKITLITSLELQMHPNVSRNSMWYSNT
ncbi:hypothetical protein F2Q69_00054589 [Brassica cretica]|uniref:Uncharacterized protein n=1 Tax=Brassica cretica TaxID=69181 RepID=A0A8S9MUS3_BRACR|nr:hypothetical protein F2Q69_00054589 [Brassica cretica]